MSMSLLQRFLKGRSLLMVIARAAGKPNASQAVGQILKKNPNPIIIPCHRVVKSTRELGGYVYGPKKKFELLIRESVKMSKGNILDFEKINFEF
ncbi:MAG: cysteine methyltransferase [Thaumarchaeota archaeon]|nr:cysteine methyltransferase [Nitrososphaerota archaeon]